MLGKILHIGGSDSPHVIGIMEQVKNAGFDQALISYTDNVKGFDREFLKNIPQYQHSYQRFFTKNEVSDALEKETELFIADVVNREKPDIIHGHYLSKCAVPMYHAMKLSGKPGIVVPWSTWDIPKNIPMHRRNKRCLDMCSYVMCNNTKFLTSLLTAFEQPASKALFCSPVVRLYLYKEDDIPNVTSPRIYIPRRYYQEIIFKALPKIIKLYPNVKITALSPRAIQQHAKNLGIYNKITFLPAMLSQVEFSEMIKRHNIIFSMAPDGGTGGTTMQAAYFGAITFVHRSTWSEKILKDDVNVLECTVNSGDVESKLVYAIKNLAPLTRRFKRNNAFLKKYDAGITGKNLVDAYNRMIGGVT